MRVARLLPIVGLLAACAPHFTPDAAHGFLPREVDHHEYFVYVPTTPAPPDGKWPVILYLHGGGERGHDGIAPTQVGLGPVVQKSNGHFPFIVVFPQCDSGNYWPFPTMQARALAALDDTLAHFPADPKRVYLTGNSLGGYGTWAIAAKHPGRFAALAPICGGVKPPLGKVPPESGLVGVADVYAKMAEWIGKTPAWIFHGAKDWLVPVDESRRMAEALQRSGDEVKLTIWPGVGHEAEVPTYADQELFDWFLQHSLK